MKDIIKNDYFRACLITWIVVSFLFLLVFPILKSLKPLEININETFWKFSIGYVIFLLIYNLIGLIRVTPLERTYFPFSLFGLRLEGADRWKIIHTIIFLVLSVIYVVILRYFLR